MSPTKTQLGDVWTRERTNSPAVTQIPTSQRFLPGLVNGQLGQGLEENGQKVLGFHGTMNQE